MRFLLTVAAGAAAAALMVAGASAKPKMQCEVMPSSFGDVPADITVGPNATRVEWTGEASATMDCGPLGVLGVDVWEHAYYVFGERDNGKPVTFLRGRAEIVIDFTGAGITVPLEGPLLGRTLSDDTIDIIVRAASPGGAKLELEQAGVFDLDNETILDFEFKGFIVPAENALNR